MDIFESTPRDKFFDILFKANRNIIEKELEAVFCELAWLRILNEKKEGEVNLISNNDELKNGLSDIYIDLSSKILSQNE